MAPPAPPAAPAAATGAAELQQAANGAESTPGEADVEPAAKRAKTGQHEKHPWDEESEKCLGS